MPLNTGNNIDEVRNLQLPVGIREYDETANIGNMAQQQAHKPFYSPLTVGLVIRAGAGTYDAVVRTAHNPHLLCVQSMLMSPVLSGIGVADSHIPVEGSSVLVYIPEPDCALGIIIAVCPPLIDSAAQEHQHAGMLDPEPGAAHYTEQAYIEPLMDPEDVAVANANAGRAIDVFPGNFSLANELGVSVSVRNLMAQIRASQRAKIETYILDDLVRITSGQFQHFNALGEQHIYNSEGNVTAELSGSQHQCEVMGYGSYTKEFVKESKPDTEKARQCGYELNKADATMMRRLSFFLGHLPGIMQFFVTSPENGNPMTYDKKAKDNGLCHFGVDDNGRVLLRSASDILLQRCDHIAVPKKRKEPWDPTGKHYSATEAKEAWKWGDNDLRSRPLQQRDAEKWWLNSLYKRFWKNAEAGDWYLPEESEISLKDEYDTVEGSKEDYSSEQHKNKTCGITLRKDGGITLRDHAGAEISLIDGRVVITAPEGVEIRSGKSIVGLAGEDVVMKAHDSVDVSATDKDVRIKSSKNMQMYAGESMLLECDADSEQSPSDSPTSMEGEDVDAKGITIKATKSRVFTWAKNIHFAALRNIFIETIERGSGTITMAARWIQSSARAMVLATGTKTGLVMTKNNAVLTGDTALLSGESAAHVTKGSKAMVPIDWADIDFSPHANVAPTLERVDDLRNAYDWLEPFEPDSRDTWLFSFRNAQQCGTSDDFRIYESLWSYQARKAGTQNQWKEEEVNGTYPWPARERYSDSCYYQLDKEINVEDTKTGKPISMGERKKHGAGFKSVTFDNYTG